MKNELIPCPVCGKKPKINFHGINYATVECKPWYSRIPHRSVFVGYEQPSKVKAKAVEEWNKAASDASLPVW